jgi:hypothetical protein
MSPRLLKDEKGSSPSSKGGGWFQESKIYESTRDGEGSGPDLALRMYILTAYLLPTYLLVQCNGINSERVQAKLLYPLNLSTIYTLGLHLPPQR